MKFERQLPSANKQKTTKAITMKFSDVNKGKVFKNGIWLYDRQMDSTAFKGFIYLIKDPYMERFYLGKKNYRSTRGKNKGNEMDWRTYKSSSKSIKYMLEERSLSDFEFHCIEEYKTLGGLSHAETWTLCVVEALTTDEWYNRLINKIAWVVNEKVTERHKRRLCNLIGKESFI